jgi:predicted dinucleotide-binding enzyme
MLQAHLPTSRVVKAFNHLYARDLTGDSLPAGSPDRRALAIAGDDPEAKGEVARLINAFGFDTVDAGPLAEGWRFQRDEPAYIARLDKEGLSRALQEAKRYRDM